MKCELKSNFGKNSIKEASKSRKLFRSFYGYKKYFPLVIMFFPAIVYFVVFKYVPMYGVTMAFKDYNMSKGILASPWVGLKHFEKMMRSELFTRGMANTLIISFQKIIFGFPAPIILALLLNEIKNLRFKKIVQTVSYMPHFLSWVVLSGIFTQLLSPSTGAVNYALQLLGMEPIFFLASNDWFRTVLVATDIWAGVGWSTIIYMAAISGISPEYYEAAECDGATRFQKMFWITLPLLAPTIATLFILRVGGILDAGFDQVFNLYNSAVYETGDIIDTYVYRIGLGKMQYSLSTAVGLFKNVIGFMLVIITNFVSKKLSGSGVW